MMLFFNKGPLLLDPPLYFLFVSFYGFSLWFLRTPAQGTEETPDMVNVVSNAKEGKDKLGHSRTCPEVGWESRHLCSFEQFALQLLLSFFIELLRAPGGFRLYCLSASF